MNTWKKFFTLSLVAFQMGTFAISNTVHAADITGDGVITLSDLHSSKYSLNSNTDLSFGKLYSPTTHSTASNYSLTTEDNRMDVGTFQNGIKRTTQIPTSVTNQSMDFNPETTPWQNTAVIVDYTLTGDDTAIVEKSAMRCYDWLVFGGNSNVDYWIQYHGNIADGHNGVMEDMIVGPEYDVPADDYSNGDTTFDYFKHGDGLGYGSERVKQDGKFGSNDNYAEYLDDLDPGDNRESRSEFYGPITNPHLYMMCRSTGTKWTTIHQMYAVNKLQFTVVHAEDVNGNDVKSKVSIDDSGIQYDTTQIDPRTFYDNYSNPSVNGNPNYGGSSGDQYQKGTLNMNRVHGTLKINGANGYKNVAANIVINAKVVSWTQVGWGFLEPEESGPANQESGSRGRLFQFTRLYDNYDKEIGEEWHTNDYTNYGHDSYWHDGYWNDDRTYKHAITAANGYVPEAINLSYNRNSYSNYNDGYNIDETNPGNLTSKSWYWYNTSQGYTRGAYGIVGNWVNQDITTQIYAQDNLSGIDTDRSYIYIDDKSHYGRDDWTKHYFDYGSERIKTGYKIYYNEDQITFTEDGIYYIQGKLWDVADNYRTDTHGAYKLDKTKPDIPLYSDDNRTYIDDPLTVTVTLRDNLSGVDHAEWAITRNTTTYTNETKHLESRTTPEDEPYTPTSFNVPIDSNGTWYIHTWVTDRAGNTTYKMSNGYKFFKITPQDVTLNPTTNGSNILRGTRFDVVTTIPYFTQEDGINSILHYIMPNWVNDDVDKKANGNYAITPGTGTDTHCSQYGPTDQAILWKAYVVPYGTPLTKNKNGDVIGPYQTVVIRLQYTNYIYGEKITHDLPINYSVIPEVIVKTEIINNPL